MYLLHFASKYRHCQHYIGYTAQPLGVRLGKHCSGNGAALTQAVARAGIAMAMARSWPPEAATCVAK